MAKIKIQQVRSTIKCPKVQKATPAILGMVEKVKHLVKVID